MIKENTPLNDKIVLIGKITSDTENKDRFIDDSVKPKKGQLGFVDKSFITQGEEGFNIAKVRIREERIPAIGDKMASRAGQKGTLGLIIPEEDMPFTSDGIRPDLIINPHAIPSRMTIGQIVESLFGKACASYGAFGDCTAFQVKGSNYSTYAPFLVKAGFNSTGNQILYNGMTGEQIQSDIYIGPTYYMRLKHMVKDKINYRATGPRTNLTRQTVQGRANDGGLRIGEMERDGVLAHGMSYFLNESFMIRGDEYYMAICNKTGAIAIYNEVKNLFLSPFADGPVNFHTNPDGSMNIQNISKFGRSFSILRIPYSFKLLIQELQTMNIQMRLITDENVDQMLSLSYSNNINELLQISSSNDNTNIIQDDDNYTLNVKNSIFKIKADIKNSLTKEPTAVELNNDVENTINEIDSEENELPNIPIDIKPEQMNSDNNSNSSSIPYAPGSPAYQSNGNNSEEFQSGTSSPYAPDMNMNMDMELANTPMLIKKPTQSEPFMPRTPSISPPVEEKKTILEVEEEKKESEETDEKNGSDGSQNNGNGNSNTNETKKIVITSDNESNNSSNSNETKKINL
jgi:hypothetical protein